MAILKKISELTAITTPAIADVLAIVQGAATYKIAIADLFKIMAMSSFTETEYDNGSVASGTFTPDCDTNGNSHRVTLTGTVTFEVPTRTLTGSEMIEGGITVIGGDTNTPTWGADWDWGTAGAPTLTAKSMLGFKRRAGDTKTMVWHVGGFS